MMTKAEITEALRQLALPENAVRVGSAIQDAADKARTEQMMQTFICVFAGFVIGDDDRNILPPECVASWLLGAVRAVASGPGNADVSATPETLILRLQAIVDALRVAASSTKN